MADKYFVLTGSDDSEPSFYGPLTKEQVLSKLVPEHDGDTPEIRHPWKETDIPESKRSGRYLDLRGGFGGGDAIIIKGEIVTPTPKKIVESFDIP